VITAGYQDFADRWNPIIDIFDEVRVRFALEVHPSEIAYDYWSTVATLDAIGHRPGFGLNFDPSHMVWQDLDYVGFLSDFKDRIYHVDCKDTKVRMHNGRNGRNGRLGSHLPWADPRRGWDFISTGHGDTRWEDIFRMLNHIGYDGPISIEWEDAGMDRLDGASEALGFIRGMNAITPSTASFDAAFATTTEAAHHEKGRPIDASTHHHRQRRIDQPLRRCDPRRLVCGRAYLRADVARRTDGQRDQSRPVRRLRRQRRRAPSRLERRQRGHRGPPGPGSTRVWRLPGL
jgi:hypothetical protein